MNKKELSILTALSKGSLPYDFIAKSEGEINIRTCYKKGYIVNHIGPTGEGVLRITSTGEQALQGLKNEKK
jgi:hypothetical protein